MPDVVTWRRAVEMAVEGYVPDTAAEVLDSVAFVESLAGTEDLDGEDLAVAVREAVDAWQEMIADPTHPHAPAGSPTGGQFTATGGGGGKTKPATGKGKPGAKPAPKPAAKPTGDLAFNGKSGAGYGMRGGDQRVHALQQALNRLGIKDAQGQPLADDGKYGPRTTAAVRSLQRRLGMQPTGVVTPELLAQVMSMKSLPKRTRATHADEPELEGRVLEGVETEDEDTIDGRVIESLGTDNAGGRVFRVRIIRVGESKNGRRYTGSVLRNAAPKYEGAKAYDHHRTADELRTSTINGLVGSVRAVGFESDGLYGDLHLLPSATHTAEALDASLAAQAQGLPPLVGISHDVLATYATVQAGGRRLQEATAITKVNSADVVADPAAGGIATRMVAGGTEETNEGEDVPVTDDAVFAALESAPPERLAALLTKAGMVTPTPTPTAESTEVEVRATEAGEPKTSMLASLLIREKLAEAGLSQMRESLLARLPERIVEADIDREIAAYKAILGDAERAGLTPTATVAVTRESRDKVVEGVNKLFDGDYSVFRSFKQAVGAFTGYRPRSWSEDDNRVILRECVGGLYDSATRATESMTSSSWAEVLGDSITRKMVADYSQPALQSWRQIVSDIVPISDFRTQRRTRIGGYGTLPVVAQGAPYQPLTSPTDEEATYAIEKKGGTEDLTLEMIANDDVGAIRKIPQRLGLAAARTLHNFVWDFLSTNPTLYDSVAFFHASHANTTAVALSQTNLSSLRQKLRDQTGYGDTSNILSMVPKFLIVPNELEELAFQLCTSAVAIPATPAGPTDTPNIHQGMKPIVIDYFTDANDWYVSADPNMCPTIEIGFYQGRDTPELFTQSEQTVGSMFNSDTMTIKIRHTYKGAVIEYRGFQRGTQ